MCNCLEKDLGTCIFCDACFDCCDCDSDAPSSRKNDWDDMGNYYGYEPKDEGDDGGTEQEI